MKGEGLCHTLLARVRGLGALLDVLCFLCFDQDYISRARVIHSEAIHLLHELFKRDLRAKLTSRAFLSGNANHFDNTEFLYGPSRDSVNRELLMIRRWCLMRYMNYTKEGILTCPNA